MKRIAAIIILMILPVGAWAQVAGTGEIQRAGTHIKMNGERLSPEAQAALLSDINGMDYVSSWEKAGKGRNTGLGLTIGGGVAALGGSVVVVAGLTSSIFGALIGGTVGSIGGQESAQQGAEQGAAAGQPITTAGLVVTGAGLVAMGVGIPMLIKNTKTLNRIVNTCNDNKASVQMSLGPTRNGFGLSLQF